MKYFFPILTFYRFALCCVFDRLSFYPMSFDPRSFDPGAFDPRSFDTLSVNQKNLSNVES